MSRNSRSSKKHSLLFCTYKGANARLMSCGIKNVSRAGRARGGKALELQLSVQFIRPRYFRINFAIRWRWSEREGRGERGKQGKINASARETVAMRSKRAEF